jgi:hypothetical protein
MSHFQIAFLVFIATIASTTKNHVGSAFTPSRLQPLPNRRLSSSSRIFVVDDNRVGQISASTTKKSETDDETALNFNVYEVSSLSSTEPTTLQMRESKEVDFGSGLLWRGVVVILCGLWASNFAAAKLVMAEPGTLLLCTTENDATILY